MFNTIKILLSPYFNHVKVDFRPLEFIEIEQDKPLIIKLSDKWQFKTHLQNAKMFIKFNSNKTAILTQLEKLEGEGLHLDGAKTMYYKLLIRLLYEISKNTYKGFFKKRKYYKYLNDLFMNDFSYMIDVFTKVLDYNSSLKKKALNLKDFKIFQESVLDLTRGGVPLSDLIKIDPDTGEKSFIH